MSLLITICARGGSKGVQKKNIQFLDGVPLIVYSIWAAQEFSKKVDSQIALSTEDEEIIEIAKEFGLSTDYVRPENLATDSAGKIAVIDHVLNYFEEKFSKKYDYVLDLDVSSPLRTQSDLMEAFKRLKSNIKAINIFSVSYANKNPYFNMVEEGEGGFVSICKKVDKSFLSRQAAPKVYELNASFYIYKREFFTKRYRGAIVENMSLAFVMNHICFDIDSMNDFLFMKFLIENKQLDFSIERQ